VGKSAPLKMVKGFSKNLPKFALMIAKKINGARVFPMPDSHDVLKSKKRYVNIRIATPNKGKSIDVNVYLENGERLKINRDDWSAKSGVIDHLYPEQIDHP
jgi:hypothetical protein